MPVVVLTGMRQVGKSTLLHNAPGMKERRFFDLDDFATLEGARENPESLLRGDAPVTVDEAQKCPELLTVIKRLVDANRRPGRFLLSGSANFALLEGVLETLAGRAIYLTLHPFSRRELREAIASKPFLVSLLESGLPPEAPAPAPVDSREVRLGGMPTVNLETEGAAEFWFRGYEQTYLERDLRELSQVADLVVFRNLLRLAALRTGQILQVSSLARDAKLNSVTAARYLNLAETSFIIRRVPPFLANRASRLIKSPKLYYTDSGIACHMAGIQALDRELEEPLRGALFETYAAQNLSSIIEAHLPGGRLFFWHVQGRHEVDLVVEHGRQVVAIEIKAGTRWDRSDLAGLRAFLRVTPACMAAILAYNGTETVQLDDRLWVLPLGALLS